MNTSPLNRLHVEAGQQAPAAVPPAAVWQALREIITSPAFARAPRMCRLLSFLVEKKLQGAERDVTEYAIGLDVFDRDPRRYSTAEDPLVRVQVGRLRERLNVYYDSVSVAPQFKISIPLGNYVPVLQSNAGPTEVVQGVDLLLIPLHHIGADLEGAAFTLGLDDELSTRLFATLGGRLRLQYGQPAPAGPGGVAALRVEGTVRIEARRVRATIRLFSGAARHIAWQAQYDHSGPFDWYAQEALAGDLCGGLQAQLESGRWLVLSAGGALP